MAPRTPEQDFVRYRDLGDLAALAAVFDAVAGQLLLVAGHLVRDGATAEDLVQTTFVEAMRHATRFDARKPLLPWLARILTNHARMHHRRDRRRERLPMPAPRSACSAAEAVIDREAMAVITAELAQLPARYSQVLTLRLVHELSPAAIAHALGCPPETVKTRLKRGLEQLRRHLPAGLATSLALMLASGRGLAAVRADVLLQARHLAGETVGAGAASGAAALALGGFVMKQFLLRATVAVAVLALGWWGVERAGRATAAPRPATEPAALVVAKATEAPAANAPLEREALNAASPAQGEGIVFVGRCVAADTRKPVAGVNAVVHFDVSKRSVCDNELERETPAARVTSDAEGVFRLPCERRPDAIYDVRIGNREHVHRVGAFGPYTKDRAIELGDVPVLRGVHVTLAVVDRRGAPVPGVRVVASAHVVVGRNDILMQDQGWPWRSDAQGQIRVPYAMVPGSYHVHWWDAALPAERQRDVLEVPHDCEQHHAVLVWPVEDAAHTIAGEVVDQDGRPVGELSLGAEGGGTRGNATTLANGTFRMPRIGPYDADARGPVEFGLPDGSCGYEIVGKPTCNWGDRGVRLVVASAATLRVRAIDAATGAAVKDFDLACTVDLQDAEGPAIVWERYHPIERHADGTASRRVARAVHEVQVFPKDPRLAPSFKVSWDPRHGEELVVPLTPLRSCTVRVVTTDGEPVAGTELWTLQPIEAVAGAAPSPGWQEVAVPVADEQRLAPATRWGRHGIDDAPLGSARTGADGRAQVVVPSDADVVLAALGPGHVPKAVVGRMAGDAEFELRVALGASVRIVLTPKEVAQRLAQSSRQQRMLESGTQDVKTGGVLLQLCRVEEEQDPARRQAAVQIPIPADGICEHRGLLPGRYELALGGHIESGAQDGINVLWQLEPVSLRDGELNKIVLDASRWSIGRVQGQVLLNGQPWAFGAGHLWSMHWPEHRSIVTLDTDAEGRFDVEAVAGEYHLGLLGLRNSEKAEGCCALESVHVVGGATIQVVLTARNVTARVRVVDAGGAPAAGLTVSTDYTTVPETRIEWVTDADGWITIHLAPPVPFHLIVTNPNGPARAGRRSSSSGDATLGPFQIPPTGDRAEFRAQLPEGWR